MGRKVFISFLGASKNKPYDVVNYYLPHQPNSSYKTRFAPEATLRLLCQDFTAKNNDKIFFFLTSEARTYSWKDYTYSNISDKPTIGLENSLRKDFLEMLQPIVDIKEGKKEEEIWDIFNKVYSELQNNDEVIFDVTNGFRTSPMLLLTLIHYASFLKKIIVKGIYYGAFEAKEGENTPIWDLTAFASLQQWTSAADQFINYGNPMNLANLAKQIGLPSLSKKVTELGQVFITNRVLTISEGSIFTEFRSELNSLRNSNAQIPALQPILEKIKYKISIFDNDVIRNGWQAIKWCEEHSLPQQGITMLFEFLQTYYLILLGKDWKDKIWRDIISICFSFEHKYKRGTYEYNFRTPNSIRERQFSNEQKQFINTVFSLPNKSNINQLYRSISKGIRHDINHAGISSDNAKQGEQLINEFKQKVEEVKVFLNL